MNAATAIGAIWTLTACGPSEPVTSPMDSKPLSITAFKAPDAGELTTLRSAFPDADFEELDHLLYPDRALHLNIPSNGYALVQRLDSEGRGIGQGEIIDTMLSPEALAELTERLQTPLTRVHVHTPSTESKNPKNQFTLLQKTLGTRGFQNTALTEKPSLVVWMVGDGDLDEDEMASLRQHHASGGHLLLGLEPRSTPNESPFLLQLLHGLGVSLEPGVLASDFQQVWETLGTPSAQDRYNHAASRFMAHPATGSLGQESHSDLSVIFSHAAVISPRHGGSMQSTPLLLSHREAWTEITHDGQVGEGERSGSLPLALASGAKTASSGRVIILADTTALSNRWALHPGNKRFLQELLQWLLPENEIAVEEPPAQPEQASPKPVFGVLENLVKARVVQQVRTIELSTKRDSSGTYAWGVVTTGRGTSEFLGNALAENSLADLKSIRAIRSWPSPPEDRLKALGLHQPIGEIHLIDTAGKKHSLTLGGSPHNAQGRYALDTETRTVHLLQSDGLAALLGPELALEEMRLLPEREWHRFEVPGERTRRIERRGTKWILAGRKGMENQSTAQDLARELLGLRMADAQAVAPSGSPRFEAQFVDKERQTTRFLLHQTNEGWVAYSDYSRRWGLVPPRIAERIVALGDSLP